MEKYFTKLRVPISFLSFLLAIVILLPLATRKVQAGNDYPYPNTSMSYSDPWGFFYRNCTSYAAWMINRDKGTTSAPYYFKNNFDNNINTGGNGNDFGDAHNWDDAARKFNIPVDNSPRVGDIAVFEATESNSYGHVAYVESVNNDGSVNTSNYNYNFNGEYYTESNVRADSYIHFGGGNKTDLVARTGDMWNIYYMEDGIKEAVKWGAVTDKAFAGNFDTDQKDDFVIRSASTGVWYIQSSATGNKWTYKWGSATDKALVADFDGDGWDEYVIKSGRVWYVKSARTGNAWSQDWGSSSATIMVGDVNGNGKGDYIAREGRVWYIRDYSTGASQSIEWGNATDTPFIGDFNGDGWDDLAAWDGRTWWIKYPRNGQAQGITWGNTGDKPFVGDFDGDGWDDLAVWNGKTWYIKYMKTGGAKSIDWGNAPDVPLIGNF